MKLAVEARIPNIGSLHSQLPFTATQKNSMTKLLK